MGSSVVPAKAGVSRRTARAIPHPKNREAIFGPPHEGEVIPPLVLIILRDEFVEDADTPTGAPARGQRFLLAVLEGDAGDVEVGPGALILDKTLEELGRRDRAAISPADVLHVGDLGAQQLVVVRT